MAQFIRDQLIKKNIPLSKVIKQGSLSRYTFYTLMQGKAKSPKISTLEEIAKIIGCSVIELLTGEIKKEGYYKSPFFDENWQGRIFAESARVLYHVLKATNITLRYQQALELIDEICKFCLKFNKENIDVSFVEWTLEKYLSQSSASINDNQNETQEDLSKKSQSL